MAKAKRRAKGAAVGQPHDGLVKYAFSKREHAEGLLKSILPRALVALVDWATLALTKDSFIDPELRARYADLLLTARPSMHPTPTMRSSPSCSTFPARTSGSEPRGSGSS